MPAMTAMSRDLFRGSLHERPHVSLQLSQRRILDVHHVSRTVVAQAYARMLVRVERHVVQRVLGGEVGRGQVVVAGTDEKLHERVLIERVFERLRGVREAAALYAPVPLVRTKASAQDVVLE